MQNFSGEQQLNYWKIRPELFAVLQAPSPWFPAKAEDFKEMNPLVDYMYFKNYLKKSAQLSYFFTNEQEKVRVR